MEEDMGVETCKARFVTTHKVTIASVVGCITRSVNTHGNPFFTDY